MLKVFIDENLSHGMVEPLSKVFKREAWFRSSSMEHLDGTKDVPLFAHLHSLEFDAIATLDKMQLENDDETAALRANGLHWIGLSNPRLSGSRQVAATTAALMVALPQIMLDLPTTPTAFHVDTRAILKGGGVHAEPL